MGLFPKTTHVFFDIGGGANKTWDAPTGPNGTIPVIDWIQWTATNNAVNGWNAIIIREGDDGSPVVYRAVSGRTTAANDELNIRVDFPAGFPCWPVADIAPGGNQATLSEKSRYETDPRGLEVFAVGGSGTAASTHFSVGFHYERIAERAAEG